MTVRKVIKMGNPLLREVAKEFTKDEILSGDMQDLITDMWDTMYVYDGIGLAAPQIGLSRQLAVIHLEEDSERYPDLVESKKFIIFNYLLIFYNFIKYDRLLFPFRCFQKCYTTRN